MVFFWGGGGYAFLHYGQLSSRLYTKKKPNVYPHPHDFDDLSKFYQEKIVFYAFSPPDIISPLFFVSCFSYAVR